MKRRLFLTETLSAASGVLAATLMPPEGFGCAMQMPQKAYALLLDGTYLDITGWEHSIVQSVKDFDPAGSSLPPFHFSTLLSWHREDGSVIAQTPQGCLWIFDHPPTGEEYRFALDGQFGKLDPWSERKPLLPNPVQLS